MDEQRHTEAASTFEQNIAAEVEPVSTFMPIDTDLDSAAQMDADAPTTSAPETLWERVRRSLLPTPAEQAARYEQRLALLDEAVARHPQASSNYVLRGELYLEAGFYDFAVMDFQKALELASRQLETERWGVITQTMRDRAYDGLNRALRLRARERQA